MIELLVPNVAETYKIQNLQNQFYWSRSSDLLFKREGVLSVRRVTVVSSDCTALIVCRECLIPEVNTNLPTVFEGPLDEAFLSSLGLSVKSIMTDEVILNSSGISYPIHKYELLVRDSDNTAVPLNLSEEHAKWRNIPFKLQFLEGFGWEPILDGFEPNAGLRGAVAVKKGNCLIFGFQFLDLLTRCLAVPPLNARYGGFTRLMNHSLVTSLLIKISIQHFIDSGAPPPLLIDKWPKGYKSALTVRHDYDRFADHSKIDDLLLLYRRLGISASIGFLPNHLDGIVLDKFSSRGHEIQIHLASPSQANLRDDIRSLRDQSGLKVSGVTVHGGPKGIGFRGQQHFEWFDDLGLSYCETFGLRDSIPVPVCRVYDDIPDSSRLLVTPGHFSLDGSTLPNDHRLATLSFKLPRSLEAGHYTIVMNHPDIHHEQLCELLNHLPLDKVWCATTEEVVSWHRATRYESTVKYINGSYLFTSGGSFPLTATLRLGEFCIDFDMSKNCTLHMPAS